MKIINGENENYQHLNPRDQDNYYFLPIFWKDGKNALNADEFIKIPKPREVGALQLPINYMIRYTMYGKKNGYGFQWKSMFSDAKELIGPVNIFSDNLFSTGFNILARNKDWKGYDVNNSNDLVLINGGQSDKAYDESTTDLAIMLGKTPIAKAMKLSPKSIDELMDSYLGTIYDMGIAPQATKATSRLEYISRQFVLDSVFSNRDSTEYWQKYTQLYNANKIAEQGYGKEGASEEFDNFRTKYGYDISSINTQLNALTTDSSLSMKERNQLKRALREKMNIIYRAGVKGADHNVEPAKVIADAYNKYTNKNGADIALENLYNPQDSDKSNSPTEWNEGYANLKKTTKWKNASKSEQKKLSNDFLKVYVRSARAQAKTGGSKSFAKDQGVSIAIQLCDRDKQIKTKSFLEKCFGIDDDTIERSKKYVKKGGNLVSYSLTDNQLYKRKTELNASWDYGTQAMILANRNKRDIEYEVEDINTDKINPARCLKTKGWTAKEYKAFKDDYEINGNSTSDEVKSAIEKKTKNREERASLWALIKGTRYSNPYGSIKDYSLKKDKGTTSTSSNSSSGSSGYSGYSRNYSRRYSSYRHYSHRSGGSSGGSSSGGEGSYSSWLKSNGYSSSSSSSSSTSSLNETFRKKQLGYLQASSAKIKSSTKSSKKS